MNNQELTKFEFLLTIDENIVVQRLFSVRNFNPDVKRSVDLYECVTNICNEISEDLKKKTFEFLTNDDNFYLISDEEENEKINTNEHFLLEIKLGNDIFIQRMIPAYVYHPKARYIDIRPKIKSILAYLSDTMSGRKLETTYLQYNLMK